MYKLIASSFDDTLIDYEGRIPLSTILLFDKLRRKNIKIVIATDRCLKSVLDYNKDFTFCDYLITSNGAYIYDVTKEKVMDKKHIGIRTVKKIIKNYYHQSTIYLTNHNKWNLISETGFSKKDFDVEKVLDEEKFLEENKDNIYKIDLYFQTLSSAKRCLKWLQGQDLKININLLKKEEYLIEITDQQSTRLKGLEKVLAKSKLTLKDVIFFGNDDHDLEIMKKVGYGVAVSNATEKVKKVADATTLDHNSKGVEEYLKEIFQ